MTSPPQKAAQMLAVAADLLDQGQTVNRLSIALTAIGLGVLLIPMVPASDATQPTAAVVALVGIVELFLAMRVATSAAQFRRLADDASTERLDIAAYDAALAALKFVRVKQKQPGKPIGRRIEVARLFLVAQVGVFVLQVAVAIAGSMTIYFNAV
jgi:hypothetical protein